eukprot:gene11234-11319_t
MLASDTVAEFFPDRTPRALGARMAEPAALPRLRWQAGVVRRLAWLVLALLVLTQITMAFAVVSPLAFDVLVQVRRLTWLVVATAALAEVLTGDPSALLRPVAAFVPFVVVGMASALLSIEPLAGLADIAHWLITMLAACLLGRALRGTNLPALLTAWFLIALLSSAAIAVLGPRIGVVSDGRFAHGVWRGIFVHKNWLAWYAGFGVLLAAFAGSLRLSVRLVLGAVALACLYFAHSAGTIVVLAAVLALLTMVALWRRLGLSTGLQLLASGLVLGFAGIVGWGGYAALLAAMGRNATLTGRTSIWQAYFSRALDGWLFGSGPASFTGLSLTTADVGLKFQNLGKIFTPHNMFIAIFGETGLIGLLAYAGAFAAILVSALRLPAGPGRMLLLAFTLFFLVSGLDETHEVFGVGAGVFLIVLLRAWHWHGQTLAPAVPGAARDGAHHPIGGPDAGARRVFRVPRGLRRYAMALGPTGLALALQFVTFAITARGLGVIAFGLYSAVTALAAILIELIGCGISDVLVRGVARDAKSFAGHFGQMLIAFALTFPPVLLAGAGLLALTGGVALPLSVALVGLGGEMIAARMATSTESILVAHGDMAGAAAVRVVTACTRLVAALCFFAVARALALWVWVVLAQSLVLALGLGLYVICRFGAPRFAWSALDLRAGQAFAVNQTARALQGNIDRLVLAGFADPAALGAYAAGARLLVVGLFPIQVLTRMLYPEFFRRGLSGLAATRAYARAQAPAMLATGLAAFAAVALVAQILPHLLGHDFAASRNAAVLLASALPLIGLQYLAADTLTGAGHQGLRAGLATGASLGSGVLMIAGVRLLGGTGGVVAGFVAGHALFLAVLIAASRLSDRKWSHRHRTAAPNGRVSGHVGAMHRLQHGPDIGHSARHQRHRSHAPIVVAQIVGRGTAQGRGQIVDDPVHLGPGTGRPLQKQNRKPGKYNHCQPIEYGFHQTILALRKIPKKPRTADCHAGRNSGLLLPCLIDWPSPGRPVVTGIAQRMPPRAVGRGWRILGAGLLVLPAAGLPSCGAAHDSRSSHDRAILWHEDFAGGAVRWSDWTRCEQPWNDRVSACSNLAAGSGEQIYWDPALMRGGRDPVAPGADGGISLLARPITADERDLMVKATARQRDLQPAHRQALAQVGWTTAWMQTRTAYPTSTTIAARLRPGAGASFWGGFWTLNETAHGHGHWPPEIDIAEVTNEPDGRMRVRQVIHFRDAAGKLQTAGCPQALLPRDWITAFVSG